MKIKTEWRKAPDFAEIAEALGVTTKQIMALTPTPRGAFVLYTPEPDSEIVWSVGLRRDNDGILQKTDVPVMHPELWEEIKRGIEERFGDA